MKTSSWLIFISSQEEYKDAIQLSMKYQIALSVYFPPILIAVYIYIYI